MARDKNTDPVTIPDLPILTAPELVFATAVFQGKTASDAYRLAYPHCLDWQPSTVWAEASREKAKDKVRTWLKAMAMNGLQTALPSLEQHIADLKELSQLAREAGNFGAAVQCEMNIGKVTGHYVDKIQSASATMGLVDALRKLDPELRDTLATQYGVSHLLTGDKPSTTH